MVGPFISKIILSQTQTVIYAITSPPKPLLGKHGEPPLPIQPSYALDTKMGCRNIPVFENAPLLKCVVPAIERHLS
jgi:hypothetical protein